MLVRYLGHSSFYVRSSKGTTIIIDPYSTQIPYNFPTINCDICLVSHEHRDHNADWRIAGMPKVVKRTCEFAVEFEVPVPKTDETMTFYGLPTFHDGFSGRKRGPNTIWHFYLEGVHFAHLGDLGHLLTQPQMDILEKVDVMFLPVGGRSCLTPTEAALVINQLMPNLVFPMHYKTPLIEHFDLADEPVESFLSRMDNVEHASTMAMDVDLARLPSKTKVVVLNYE